MKLLKFQYFLSFLTAELVNFQYPNELESYFCPIDELLETRAHVEDRVEFQEHLFLINE